LGRFKTPHPITTESSIECVCHSIEFNITRRLGSHVVLTTNYIPAPGTDSVFPTCTGRRLPTSHRFPLPSRWNFPTSRRSFPRKVACRDSNAANFFAVEHRTASASHCQLTILTRRSITCPGTFPISVQHHKFTTSSG
jgi:hypothetical protein